VSRAAKGARSLPWSRVGRQRPGMIAVDVATAHFGNNEAVRSFRRSTLAGLRSRPHAWEVASSRTSSRCETPRLISA
jgi:hypothetical protein